MGRPPSLLALPSLSWLGPAIYEKDMMIYDIIYIEIKEWKEEEKKGKVRDRGMVMAAFSSLSFSFHCPVAGRQVSPSDSRK